MSTRSRIGIELEDGSIKSVYHHFDGYPEGLGVKLLTHYTTEESVNKLIDGGNMSNCWSDSKFNVETGEFTPIADPKPAYYGGEDEKPVISKKRKEFVWGEFPALLDFDILEKSVNTIGLDELLNVYPDILKGNLKNKIVVDVNK